MSLVTIQNIGCIFYINGKRLGHDKLSDYELEFINNFCKEFKLKDKTNEPV